MSSPLERLTTALADRYRVERELGAGGMATVYLAHDLKHERDVAIKVLHPDLGAALGADRFLSEIKTTAKLQHPHILPLLDSGAAEGLLYYVMPYVRGETLRERITRESQLPVADAVRITTEVADALGSAHDAGIVHRDIKPENILLQGGHALVADFGIALAVQQAGGPRMTQTGLSLGTPQYMSPEQAMGDRVVDHRTDIYALGAVAYEMLTGEPPHLGTSAQAIVAKLLTEPVRPLTVLRPTVPAHVDAAVQTALSKLPADRFATVLAFRDALRDGTGVVNATTTRGRSVPERRGSRALVAGAVAATVVAATVGWWVGSRGTTPAVEAQSITVPLRLPPATVVGNYDAISVSPDGQFLAYLSPDSASRFVGRVLVAGLSDERRLRLNVNGGSMSFSPSAKRLAMLTLDGVVQVHEVDGSVAPQEVATLRTGSQTAEITWLGDSTLVVREGGSLFRLDIGRKTRDSLPLPAPAGMGYGNPEGVSSRLVLARRGEFGLDGDIGVVDVETNQFTSLGVTGKRPQFVASGIVTYLRAGEVWGVPVNPRTLARAGAERRIVTATPGQSVRSYGVSRNGTLVLRRGLGTGVLSRELVITNRSGVPVMTRAQRGLYRSVRFSPDGKRLLFTQAISSTRGGDLYLLSLADNGLLRLTTDSANLAPEWSSDERFVYFARLASRFGMSEVVRIPIGGGGTPEVLLRRAKQIYEFQVAPNGASLLWREDVALNSRDILSASFATPDSVRDERTTRFNERGVSLSPDGAWYAFTSDETGESEVYVSRVSGDGARWPVSSGGGGEPRWTPTGELFFRRQDTVFVSRVQTGTVPQIGAARPLFGARYYATGNEPVFDVSRDGQRFVFVREPEGGAQLDEMVLMLNWVSKWQGASKDREP